MSSGPAKACHPGSCGSIAQLHVSFRLDSGRAGQGCICLESRLCLDGQASRMAHEHALVFKVPARPDASQER